jgi:hypothetical protein
VRRAGGFRNAEVAASASLFRFAAGAFDEDECFSGRESERADMLIEKLRHFLRVGALLQFEGELSFYARQSFTGSFECNRLLVALAVLHCEPELTRSVIFALRG